jgi:hypothetical protein
LVFGDAHATKKKNTLHTKKKDLVFGDAHTTHTHYIYTKKITYMRHAVCTLYIKGEKKN